MSAAIAHASLGRNAGRFGLLLAGALTSMMALLEVVVSWIQRLSGLSRGLTALLVGGVIFLLGVPASLGYGPFHG